jgi:hypothetical protein
MPVARDLQSLTTAAEQAASGGDFASAARYLQLAADLQEAGAGSMPVELANTLNNLGVVYERLDRSADAERSYRRAFAVARAVLPADHPSVALSEKNLRDFCEGRGIRFEEEPRAEPKPRPTTESEPDAGLKPRPTSEGEVDAGLKARPTGSRSMLVLGVIAVLALVALAFLAVRSMGGRDATTAPAATAPIDAPTTPAAQPTAEATPPAQAQPTAPLPANTTPSAASAAPAPATPAPSPAPVSSPPEPAPRDAPRVARPAIVPTVVSASVCGTLATRSDWQCGPPSAGPGTFFYYTRLAAPAATTVQHRWYRDGRLHQSVSLRVAANPGQGYRTYSRVAISAERAGEWRVELRAPDGTVLHEERFTVVR